MVTIPKILERMHTRVETALRQKKKWKEPSVILSLMSITRNDTYTILKEACLEKQEFTGSEFEDLKSQDLVKESDELNKIIITAKGVWEVEKRKGLGERDLLNYIQNKIFEHYESGTALSEREKVVIFSMVAARTFSKESCVDLKASDVTKSAWKEIIEQAYQILHGRGILTKLKKDEIFGKPTTTKTEPPVMNIFRHTDACKTITKNIFQSLGGFKYYLNVFDERNIIQDSLVFILKLIFEENRLSTVEIDEFVSFCNRIANDKGMYIFTIGKNQFSKPEFDLAIRDAFMKL